jgi:hypothetical protein
VDWKILIGILIIGVGAAQPASVGIDQECMEMGYDYGIEKFEFEDNEYLLEEDNPSYDIMVEGDALSLSWTSEPSVAGVVMKSALMSYDFAGGTSGTVTSQGKEISHITFCGRNEVPEFGFVGGIIALLGGTLVLLLRR